MAIGEGALRIDLRSGEAWCDGEPLPPLFIAGELRGWLAGQGVPPESLEEAQLEALFAPRLRWSGGREVAGLQISCCVRLVDGDEVWRADARNG